MDKVEPNWIGKTWMKEYNNGLMPSLNQISEGLIAEAMFQLESAMGDIKEQKHVLAAKANIKKTWEDLLAEGYVPDRDAPLGEVAFKTSSGNYYIKDNSILRQPDSSVVGLILHIY